MIHQAAVGAFFLVMLLISLIQVIDMYMHDPDRWHDGDDPPPEVGWYEVVGYNDEVRYFGWGPKGNARWWKPLKDGWLAGDFTIYRWRGPVADIHGPAPDGTDPKPE